jgi:hypothetical protein
MTIHDAILLSGNIGVYKTAVLVPFWRQLVNLWLYSRKPGRLLARLREGYFPTHNCRFADRLTATGDRQEQAGAAVLLVPKSKQQK